MSLPYDEVKRLDQALARLTALRTELVNKLLHREADKLRNASSWEEIGLSEKWYNSNLELITKDLPRG